MSEQFAIPKKIRQKLTQYRSAQAALEMAVRDHYRIGCLVEVTIGRSTFHAMVKDYVWNNPTKIIVMNLKTGSMRKVSVTYAGHNVRIINS